MKLTEEQEKFLYSEFQSYDTAMGDAWRNDGCDTYEEGVRNDEIRKEQVYDNIIERFPEIPRKEIEKRFDYFLY